MVSEGHVTLGHASCYRIMYLIYILTLSKLYSPMMNGQPPQISLLCHQLLFMKHSVLKRTIYLKLQVEYQTASGQMLDLITTPAGEVDLSLYVMPTYVM